MKRTHPCGSSFNYGASKSEFVYKTIIQLVLGNLLSICWKLMKKLQTFLCVVFTGVRFYVSIQLLKIDASPAATNIRSKTRKR